MRKLITRVALLILPRREAKKLSLIISFFKKKNFFSDVSPPGGPDRQQIRFNGPFAARPPPLEIVAHGPTQNFCNEKNERTALPLGDLTGVDVYTDIEFAMAGFEATESIEPVNKIQTKRGSILREEDKPDLARKNPEIVAQCLKHAGLYFWMLSPFLSYPRATGLGI